MKKKLKQLLKYNYPVRIFRYPDGMYCAELENFEGLCAYGKTAQEALQQLDGVKEAAFELLVSQGKEPPVPKVRLEIPVSEFRRNPQLKKLKAYMKF
jgi:predicted RNase H-like HicB family nuclease